MAAMFSLRSVLTRFFSPSRMETYLIGGCQDATYPERPAERRAVNPIVEQLQAFQTDAERAQWLLCVPLAFVIQRHPEINEVLSNAGYRNGLNYMAALVATLSQRRGADGYHSLAQQLTLNRISSLVRLDAGAVEAGPEKA